MDIPTVTREQSRQVDRRAIQEYGMSGLVLMENAGRQVADKLCELGIGGPVAILCGRGNNGGDGFVIARHLDLRCHEVRVLLLAAPQDLAGDALANYQILVHADVPMVRLVPDYDGSRLAAELSGADWVVDALLGTGSRGQPRPPLDDAIARFNACTAKKLAVDLPSGVDCDTGEPAASTIRAAHTCTFVAHKAGFLSPAAWPYVGQVHVLDIGAPRKLIDDILRER
jgi:NAD(P)H-hydrate epimerase